jgi:hypothetical protein
MPISPIAAGLLWLWLLLFTPPAGQADRLADDPFLSGQPKTVRYQFKASIDGLDENLRASGTGAYVQPDRSQLTIETEGQQFETVVIGQDFFFRDTAQPDWVQQHLEPGTGPLAGTPTDPSAVSPEVADLLAEMQRGFRLEGTEPLAGGTTRHFRGDFDLLALADRLGGDASGLHDGVDKLTTSIEFWVGVENNYLYALNLNFSAHTRTPVTPGASNDINGAFELTMFDHDKPLSIEPPISPAAQPQPPTQPAASPTPAPTPSPTPRPAPAQAPAQVPRDGR